jgi:branched-chain amino acid transport system ATP-binding protein
MSEMLLEARGVSAGYGGQPVIRDISVGVGRGEIVGILGANGAGKSTTLRALVGEIGLLGGKVHWRGVESRAPLHRRARDGLGYVPEDRSVFPALTVEENLRVGRGSVDDALGYFPELKPSIKRKAGLLSGGQQQMVTLGRALAGRPEVLVVDELSQGLAPLLVRRLFLALEEAAGRGVGVVLVEQHARLALGVAHRVCIMRRGQFVLQAESAQIRQNMDQLHELYLGTDHDN